MPEVEEEEYIQPEDLKVFRDESNNLCVRIKGRGGWSKVAVRQAFPYSDPGRFLVLSQDEEEIGIIRDLAELDEGSRRLLGEALGKRYHVPVIEKIESVEDAHNATRWVVETDKGRRQFLVRDRHNFRRIKGRGLIIVDVDGGRYLIPADATLDKQSLKLLEMHR